MPDTEDRLFCRPGAVSLPPLPMPPLEPMDVIFSWLCWNVQGHLAEAADEKGNLSDAKAELMYQSILAHIRGRHKDLFDKSGVVPGFSVGIRLAGVSAQRADEINCEAAAACMNRWFEGVVRPAMSSTPKTERHATLRRVWTQVLFRILNETLVEEHFLRDADNPSPWPPGIRSEIEKLLHRRRIKPSKTGDRREIDPTSTEAVIEDIICDVYGRASYEKDYKLKDGKLAMKVATYADRVKRECIKRRRHARRTVSLEVQVGEDEDTKLKDTIEDVKETKDAKEAKETAALILQYIRERKSEDLAKGRLAALDWLERRITEVPPPSKETVARDWDVTPPTLNEALHAEDDGELVLLLAKSKGWTA